MQLVGGLKLGLRKDFLNFGADRFHIKRMQKQSYRSALRVPVCQLDHTETLHSRVRLPPEANCVAWQLFTPLRQLICWFKRAFIKKEIGVFYKCTQVWWFLLWSIGWRRSSLCLFLDNNDLDENCRGIFRSVTSCSYLSRILRTGPLLLLLLAPLQAAILHQGIFCFNCIFLGHAAPLMFWWGLKSADTVGSMSMSIFILLPSACWSFWISLEPWR